MQRAHSSIHRSPEPVANVILAKHWANAAGLGSNASDMPQTARGGCLSTWEQKISESSDHSIHTYTHTYRPMETQHRQLDI